jgi:hypothetical protein
LAADFIGGRICIHKQGEIVGDEVYYQSKGLIEYTSGLHENYFAISCDLKKE